MLENEDDEAESPFYDKYQVKELLGRGAFARVVSAVNRITNEEVAVKARFSPRKLLRLSPRST